ncbi:MAG: hypothetical protein QXP66_01780 [Candidatus Aenigmatarchaeota archaeon]
MVVSLVCSNSKYGVDEVIFYKLLTQLRLIFVNAITYIAQACMVKENTQKSFEIVKDAETKFLSSIFPELKQFQDERLEKAKKELLDLKPFIIKKI